MTRPERGLCPLSNTAVEHCCRSDEGHGLQGLKPNRGDLHRFASLGNVSVAGAHKVTLANAISRRSAF
jgi:hypothetical protein